MSTEPYQLTATEVLGKYKSGDLTVAQYAESLLRHIGARDNVVKAWAYLDPDQVLEQAKTLDKVPKDQRGPLHGIAVAVKDVIYTKGMPTQFNSPIYENDQPEVDAASVIMLRQAGALILGKTTTTEFAANTVGTKTTNPHDPTRTPGGSSSGSGAAVGDFQAPLALGTQTGGSTIRPGSFNGIYALKPTWNAISREGQKIYSLDFDTIGLYARSVEDLELLGGVFGLKDDEIPAPITAGVKGLKFAFLKTMLWDHAGSGTRRAFEKGKQQLETAGAEVEEIEFPPDFTKLPEWHTCVLYSEGRVMFRPDYLKAKDKLGRFLQSHVEEAHGYSRKDFLQAFDGIAALRPKWDAIAEKYAAVVVPSVPDEAPSGLESTGSAVFNSMWTALHVPVINIPGFKGDNGMPVGLSLTLARYNDMALLNVAKEVSKVWAE
ncbi:related to glu asp-tRNA amidotransferase subunit A [Lecanosticta acicola]|uniref:Related to glu asp-tRNA amidotransferase subunit A n=1 Tax=Lecanosticta acicola TaxID=111012 RepID=A0AAI8Z6X3_9PEZI|nr:related to glu asp-tRNA amidotransferase subunit A [Lecanosticta acicola]